MRLAVKRPLSRAASAAVLVWAAGGACAADVRVAVAANFALPLERIGTAFTAATGHTLKVSPGATGKFHSQIVAGAPFEVLLAADDETPRRLIAEGLAVAGSNFTYAVGRLVLWSAQPGRVDEPGAMLRSGRFTHLAIANPKTAPYGAAAMQVLQALGLAERLAPKLVTGESIAQTFQFVATGNAELGFVALSQVVAVAPPQGDPRLPAGSAPPPGRAAALPGAPAGGSHWVVPPSLHDPIRQDAVLLRPGAGNPAATAFLAFLKSPAAQQLIRSFGYGSEP
jgi:molybdate transport system substrate-binding protein